jgi:hypothetical protein
MFMAAVATDVLFGMFLGMLTSLPTPPVPSPAATATGS